MNSHEHREYIKDQDEDGAALGSRRTSFRWVLVGLIIGLATIGTGAASTEQPALDLVEEALCPDGKTCDLGGDPSYGMGGGGDLSSCGSGGNYWGEDQL